MPADSLPADPSLEQLRKQAKDFRDRVRTGHAKFTEVARALHPRPPKAWEGFTLADAQLTNWRMSADIRTRVTRIWCCCSSLGWGEATAAGGGRDWGTGR